MHDAFCDQPWPGNEAGIDPGLSRTVGSGDTRRTRLIPCVCPKFCFVGLLSAIREFHFSVFCPRRKNQQNATSTAAIREISVKTKKKKRLTTTLRKKKNHHPALVQKKKEMLLPTIHQRTQLDHRVTNILLHE